MSAKLRRNCCSPLSSTASQSQQLQEQVLCRQHPSSLRITPESRNYDDYCPPFLEEEIEIKEKSGKLPGVIPPRRGGRAMPNPQLCPPWSIKFYWHTVLLETRSLRLPLGDNGRVGSQLQSPDGVQRPNILTLWLFTDKVC